MLHALNGSRRDFRGSSIIFPLNLECEIQYLISLVLQLNLLNICVFERIW